MQHQRKKILFINRSTPYGKAHAQESLDALLMASTFNQEISVLFIDDGVLQLKSEQNPEIISQKNFTKTFKALSLYEVKSVYVEKESLQKLGLNTIDLMIPALTLATEEIGKLMQTQDVIFNF